MTFTARGLYASSSKEPRRGAPRVLLLLGLLVACAALLWVAALLVSFASTTSEDHSTTSGDVETVRIVTTAPGTVEVSAAEPGQDVELSAETTENLFNSARTEFQDDGSEASAEGRCSNWIGLGRCSVDYRASVPPGVDVVIEARTGDVTVSDIEGAAEVTTSTGDIAFHGVQGDVIGRSTTGDQEVADHEGSADLEATTGDLQASGAGELLRADNTTGELDVVDFTAEDVQLATTTGDATMTAGSGTLTAQSTTGNLTVEVSESFQAVDAQSTTGNIDVTVPAGAGPFQVDGSSTTGDRDVQVATDPAAEARLALTTTTGNVHVAER
jgi:hypothetical protein